MSYPAVNHGREAVAGLTTFLTMAYIVVVNPSILATEGTGMSFEGVMTSTVVIAFLGTLAMGVVARLPYAMAPGMGINAFFTFTLILGKGLSWQVAMGLVFWSGLVFLLVSMTSLRESIVRALPRSIRSAAAAGIGLLLTFIGLRNAGIVAGDPQNLVRLGDLGAATLFSLIGLGIGSWLLMRGSSFAFLASIGTATLLGGLTGLVETPQSLLAFPDFSSTFFQLDILGALQWTLAPALLALLVTDLFDSLSTFVGVAQTAGLVDQDGEPVRLREGLAVDAVATLFSGLVGSSSATTYVESSAGIRIGGRTGWTAVYASLCFLPCLFLSPLAAAIPAFATAPVLIMVGLFMFRGVRDFELDRFEESLPPFLITILIPLTFSITQGILWGFVAHTVLFLLAGRRHEVSPMMWCLGVGAVLLLVLDI